MRAVSFFFFMNLLHPRSTLFPYTTLFRSVLSFYGQPWWMILLKVVAIFAFLMLMTLFAIWADRKSTRLNSSHRCISYAVFCLKKKINIILIVVYIWCHIVIIE